MSASKTLFHKQSEMLSWIITRFTENSTTLICSYYYVNFMPITIIYYILICRCSSNTDMLKSKYHHHFIESAVNFDVATEWQTRYLCDHV